MKSSVHSLGRLILILSLLLGTLSAQATDPEYRPAFQEVTPWGSIAVASGLGLLSIIGIAQLSQSEIIFAGLYTGGALYYSHEKINSPVFHAEDYVVPIALTTMAITNLTLLRQDEESKSTIITANAIGVGLTALYWYHFERKPLRMVLAPNSVHFAFEF